MNESRWDRVQEIFEKVSKLKDENREEELEVSCGHDPRLMEEVKSLLFHSDRSEDFLESSKLSQVVQLMGKNETDEDTDLPECTGPYNIVEILGKGGMGSVYIADQLQPIQRKVALKVINLGMSGEEFFNRFRYERQTLAMMNHVNIAHVFDAGRTTDGRPFFTMEFVSGESITNYCDSKSLTIKDRLRLFLQVCDGVAHAHRKGIIHRDLKPSNILVTVDEDQPVPKIIDFGIAKVMDLDQAEHRQTTIFGTVVGTPAYMSPEQADCQDVDTTTDVYAMGVVLYELIVGFLPFDAEVYRRTSITAVLKVILEMEPPSLLDRFNKLGDKNMSVAEKRQTLPRAMAKELKGDLDAVVMKAIDKDRNQRYGSIAQMADDIHRFLEDKPVEAAAHNTLYSMRKFVRRHKRGAIVFFVISLALLSGILGSTFGLIRAQKAEKAAEREAEYARENKDFLQGILASATPFQHEGQINVTDLLKSAEDELQGAALNPAEEAQLRSTLAKTYFDWSFYEKAMNHLELAMAIWEQIREPLHPDTHYTHFLLGHVLLRLEKPEPAERIARNVLKAQVASYGENHNKSLRTKRLLADIFAATERFSQARDLYRDILKRQQTAQGFKDPEVLVSMSLLAANMVQLGQYDKAEDLYRETLQIREEQLGRRNPYTLGSMHGLARVLYRQGDFEDAKALAMESYRLHVDVFGEESPLTAQILNNLNLILMSLGEVEDQEATHRRLIEERTKTFGKEDKRTLRVMNNYANYLVKTERFAEAQRLKMEELEIWRRVHGDLDHETLISSITLGQLYLKSQQYETAEKFLRDLADKLRNKSDLDPNFLTLTEGLIGACSCEVGQFSRGEAILLEAFGKLKVLNPKFSSVLYEALVDCYIKREKPGRIEAISN